MLKVEKNAITFGGKFIVGFVQKFASDFLKIWLKIKLL